MRRRLALIAHDNKKVDLVAWAAFNRETLARYTLTATRHTARLLERKQREEAEKYSAQRRGQIGTGGREEKIRTYNFPQNRVTDHRIGLTLYNLDRVMNGDLGELIQALQAAGVKERLGNVVEGAASSTP